MGRSHVIIELIERKDGVHNRACPHRTRCERLVRDRVKEKSHYTSWFRAGSEQAPNGFGASFEPASVIEFGFYELVTNGYDWNGAHHCDRRTDKETDTAPHAALCILCFTRQKPALSAVSKWLTEQRVVYYGDLRLRRLITHCNLSVSLSVRSIRACSLAFFRDR